MVLELLLSGMRSGFEATQEEAIRSWVDRLALALAAIVIVVSAFVHLRSLEGSVPYPQHVDEPALLEASARVLQTGDWNPHLYSYPSLPVYLGTAALAVGAIAVSGKADVVRMHQLGRMTAPFYEQPKVVSVARKLWWAMGVIGTVAVSVCALRLAGPSGMLLAALIGAFGASLPERAVSYINVDVPMSMFALLCLALLVTSRDRRWSVRVWVPALLCGAAIACKYTAFVLLVPCLIAQWLLHSRDRAWASLALIAGSLCAFGLFCPYFVLDLPNFVEGAAFENYHYRVRGHTGFDVTPGWPHLVAYAQDLSEVYGWPLLALSVLGAVMALLRDLRRGLVLVSYPVAVLVFLTGYKVHFARNLLPVVALLPVFAACGLMGAWRLMRAALQRLAAGRVVLAGRRADWTAAVLIALCVTLSSPWDRALARAWVRSDSRNELAKWARSSLPPGTKLIVPAQLPIDPRTLPSNLLMEPLDLADAAAVRERLTTGTLLLLPEWPAAQRGWRRRRLAAIQAGLAAIPAHAVIQRFGSRPLVPAAGTDVCVDPAFSLVRVR